MKQVNILIQRKNEIEAVIAAIENNITSDNGVIFSKEVNLLIQRMNEIEASIATIKNNITSDNGVVLIKEILNLLAGVGDGYTAEDYYANTRYYSQINGVKNIRIIDGELWVKVTAPSGYLLPEKIKIHDTEYRVICTQSTKYNNEVDY